jgi:putative acyl-CoA dehydrogenase
LTEFGKHWDRPKWRARPRREREYAKAADVRCPRTGATKSSHPAYHELMAHSAHAGVHI